MTKKINIKELAQKFYEKMSEDEKVGLTIGLYPYWLLEEFKKLGLNEKVMKEIELELMEMAQKELGFSF